MAFVAAFTASQPVGQPSVITLTDSSTGSDAAINSRRVYLRKSDGTFLTPSGYTTDYITWANANLSIDIDCMLKDYALTVKVQWLSLSGVVLYEVETDIGFTSYNEDFDYTLSTMLSANPILVNDNSFRSNKFNLRTYIDSGNKAITYSDVSNAQILYDAATELRTSSQYFFNESTG